MVSLSSKSIDWINFSLLIFSWLIAILLCLSLAYEKKLVSHDLSHFITGGGDNIYFMGGASTANLIVIYSGKDGNEVLLGQKNGHGDRLQFPGGFVDSKDIEKCKTAKNLMRTTAINRATASTGIDMEAAFGKYIQKTDNKEWYYKGTPDGDEETKRANVRVFITEKPKFKEYTGKDIKLDDELTPQFGDKDANSVCDKIMWIPTCTIINEDSVKSATGNCVPIPFYIKRTVTEALKLGNLID